MDTQQAKTEQLIDQIRNVFADLPYPGDRHIATNPQCCPECEYTDDFFRGKRWQELAHPDQKLPTGYGGLSFLSPPAWRYFMPAYMIVGLGAGEYAPDCADTAIFHLTPPKNPDLDDYFLERAEGFSKVERDCILGYINYWWEQADEDEWEDEGFLRAWDFWQRIGASA